MMKKLRVLTIIWFFVAATLSSDLHAQEPDGIGDFCEILQIGHGPARMPSWSPNGEFLAVQSEQNIWIYNTILEDPLALEGHTGFINDFDWSPDSQFIVSGSQDGTARIWDVATGNIVRTIQLKNGRIQGPVWVAYNPDGTRIASLNPENDTIHVWDIATDDELSILQGHQAHVSAFAWNLEGTQLASSSFDGTLRIWDAETSQLLQTIETGFDDMIRSLEWNRDGTRVLARREDSPESLDSVRRHRVGSVAIWNTATGELVAVFGHEYPITLANWGPGGSNVIGIEQIVREDHAVGGRIWVWDIETGQVETLLEHENLRWYLSWNLTEQRLAGVDDNVLYTLDFQTGEVLHTLKTHHTPIASLAWHPSGTRIASGHEDGVVMIWDATSPRAALGRLDSDLERVTSLDWNPEGTMLAGTTLFGGTSESARKVYIWDVGSDEVVQILTGTSAVAWSPDGTRLAASQSLRGGMQLWDTSSWESVETIDTDFVYSLAWNPDGSRLAIRHGNGDISMYNSTTGAVTTPITGASGYRLGWSPDGSQIISYGALSGPTETILWDVSSGTQVRSLGWDTGVVTWQSGWELVAVGFVWSPDGTQFAGIDGAYSIRVWGVCQ